jgi:hypothetical protein
MSAMTANTIPIYYPLTGLYQASAIQQLADGRFLVVEDEKQRPFSLVAINADGSASSKALRPGFFEGGDSFWKLDDLEGMAADRSGNIYAITSQSRDGEGEQKKPREKLLRFRIEGERVLDESVVTGLKPALLAKHSVLAHAAEIREVKTEGGLNIEALEISPDQQCLLIGFRSPLLEGRAIIACVDNVAEMFDADQPPRISDTLLTLDLGGNGIRGMAYFACLDGYLLIAGPVGREPLQFQLWFWSGQPGAPARSVSVRGLAGLARAEGITPALIDGRQRIVIVNDDGSKGEGRFARFLLLDPEQLQIAT